MTDAPNSGRFDEALAAYLEAVDAGWAPEREVLFQRYPALREQWQNYFAAEDRVQAATRPLNADDTSTGPAHDDEGPLPRAFGDYDELQEIARGGMGIVFRARQKSLNRPVALKMMLSGRYAAADELRRFHAEAEAAALMDHPHIVPIYEVGASAGRPYLSMKMIEGGCLSEQLPRLRQDVRAGVTLLMKVARAVHYAHQRGILHRDLKPANVLLDERGEPLVTDFGLARRIEGDGGITQSGAIVGTANYMAPEQAWGKTAGLTTAADVHALGAILYEMLTGRPPFASTDMVETLLRVRSEATVPPRTLVPGLDADLETICLKCLHKEPEGRYASAAALADDLQRWLNGEVIQARRAGVRERLLKWMKRNPVIAGAVATVALVLILGSAVATGFGLYANGQAELAQLNEQKAKEALAAAEAEKEKARAEEDLKGRQLMTVQLLRVEAVYERDPAAALALLHDVNACPPHQRDAAWGFYERRCRRWTLATLPADNDSSVTDVLYSPDGLTLACVYEQTGRYNKDAEARLWDVKTGRSKATHPIPHRWIHALAYSPEGRLLAIFPIDKGIRLWDVEAGKPSIDLENPELEDSKDYNVHSAAYSPDGRTLAVGFNERLSGPDQVKVVDIKANRVRATLRMEGYGIPILEFSPDGRTLAVSNLDGASLFDATTGRLERVLPKAAVPVVFSQDGLTLATGADGNSIQGGDRIFLWDTRTWQRKATLAVPERGLVLPIAFSPDGLTLAGIAGDPIRDIETVVNLWDVKTGQVKATPPGAHYTLTFSPDGQTLAGSGEKGLTIWDVSPEHASVVLTGHTGDVASVTFSPDGLTLASGSDGWRGDNETGEVLLWDMKTRRPKLTIPGPASSLAFRPDGLTLASAKDGTVRLRDVMGGQLRDTLPNIEWVQALSPDGTLYAGGSVCLYDVKTKDVLPDLPPLDSIGGGDFEHKCFVLFSPDGQTIAWGDHIEDFPDGDVRLYDVVKKQRHPNLKGHTAGVGALAFSPDSQTLASGSLDMTVRLWDLKSGQTRAILRGHTGDVVTLAFSRDGRTLASGSKDGTVRLWDVQTVQHRATLRGHSAGVKCVAFSPDGQTLASAGDSTVRLWDLRTHEPEQQQNLADWWIVEPINRLRRHQQSAAQAENDGEWSAAVFHLERLMKESPHDADLLLRRDLARFKLKPPPSMDRVE